MNRFTRFWQDLLHNWDVYLVILVGIFTLLLSVFGQINYSYILPLVLTMLGIIAISIRRDRHIDQATMNSLEELAGDVKSLAKNKVFDEQEKAYVYLVREVIHKYGVKEAVLLQYSCTTSLPLIRALLSQGAKVTIYIQHEDTASKVGSQFQAERIRSSMNNLRGNLGKVAKNLPRPDQLKIFKYRSPGTISAIKIDNRVLCVGWYMYEYDLTDDHLHRRYPDDTIEVSGHDVAALVVWDGTEEFKELEKTFSYQLKNFQKHAERVSL